MTETTDDPFFDKSQQERLTELEESVKAARPRHDAAAFLAAIVESSDDPIISKSLDGIITTWNRAAERVFGYTAAEAVGRPVTILIPDERLDEEPTILARIHSGERVDHFETVRRRKDGSLIDISLTISPIRNAKGEIIGASKIARDISERARSVEQRDLLLREMHHRVKNLFAITSSIISLAARTAKSAEDLAASTMGRLAALSKAHQLTLPNVADDETLQEHSTSLFDLLSIILAPYGGGGASWHLHGDDVEITPKKVTSLSLLLHEFSTNAAKYGALSIAGGLLDVQVRVDNDQVEILWTESLPGPVERVQSSGGFGGRLEKMIFQSLDGEIDKQWREDGLTIRAVLPKASLIEG